MAKTVEVIKVKVVKSGTTRDRIVVNAKYKDGSTIILDRDYDAEFHDPHTIGECVAALQPVIQADIDLVKAELTILEDEDLDTAVAALQAALVP